jgi:hypothetical protein
MSPVLETAVLGMSLLMRSMTLRPDTVYVNQVSGSSKHTASAKCTSGTDHHAKCDYI